MRNQRTLRLTQFSILLALELLLGLTPIGMIVIPPVSLTLLHIPVIICGIVMGPAYGGALGGVFGLISMFKATTAAVNPVDIMFSPFLSGRPIASTFMVLVPRILLGVAAGLLFRGMMAVAKKRIVPSALVSAIGGTLLHTGLVMFFLWWFFQAQPLTAVFTAILTLNGGLELVAAVVISVPVATALLKFLKRTA